MVTLKCGDRDFAIGTRTFVMGILNVTPDSFSDGNASMTPHAGAELAMRMLDAGADVVDIGGESTKPGAAIVPPDVERARVVPVIEELARRGVRAISVDTRNALTARHALAAGASWINDVTAFTHDPHMPAAAKNADAVVLMHWPADVRARWSDASTRTSGDDVTYDGDVLGAVHGYLAARVDAAVRAGIDRDRIVVDPGLGFGKNVDDNVRLLKASARFKGLAAACLVGPSRKRFVGALAGVDDPKLRDNATMAAVVCAIMHGADIVRVHDVKHAVECARVVDAVVRQR